MLKQFTLNQSGRDFCVGDIHGYFSVLQHKLKTLNFNVNHDRLFAVGDLVDRGPESDRAQEFLKYPWFHSVRGNHEQMVIDFKVGDERTVKENGGEWFLRLNDREKHILTLRFFEGKTQMEVAEEIGISQAQVSRLEKAALSHMRKHI